MQRSAAATVAVALAILVHFGPVLRASPGGLSPSDARSDSDAGSTLPDLPCVRFDNVRIREVLAYAIEKSPAFRDLLAALNLFDRTVYVEEGRCGYGRQHACIRMMTTPGGRNLLVLVNPRLQRNEVVGQLAHELYHAIEIAREPEVVDADSLRELYRRIGEHGCEQDSDTCWETRAAAAFEALVLRQLRGAHKDPATPAEARALPDLNHSSSSRISGFTASHGFLTPRQAKVRAGAEHGRASADGGHPRRRFSSRCDRGGGGHRRADGVDRTQGGAAFAGRAALAEPCDIRRRLGHPRALSDARA